MMHSRLQMASCMSLLRLLSGLAAVGAGKALERRRGRNDFPVRAMWRTLVVGVVLQHPSAAALLRELGRNPHLLTLCGFEALPRRTTAVVRVGRDLCGDNQGEVVDGHSSCPPSASRPLHVRADSFEPVAVAVSRGQPDCEALTKSTLGNQIDLPCRNA